MPVVLFVSYPLLAHLGVLLAQPALQAAALCCLFAGVFYAPLGQRRGAYWLAFLTYAAVVILVTGLGGGVYALYLPPLALTGLACAGFARSLQTGQTPLITRIAETVHGTLNDTFRVHTRRVTAIWAAVLGVLWLITLILTLTEQRVWWSWLTNVINYLVLGGLFLLDYLYRRWRYPDHDREGFIGHIRQVIRGSRARGLR